MLCLDSCTIYKLLLVLTQRDVLYKKKHWFVFASVKVAMIFLLL